MQGGRPEYNLCRLLCRGKGSIDYVFFVLFERRSAHYVRSFDDRVRGLLR